MQYVKDFMPEYRYLKENGMPEEMIEEFYNSVAHAVIKDDWKYKAHNSPLNATGEDTGLQAGAFVYQRGTLREKPEEKKDTSTGWSSIKLCVIPLRCEDDHDVYIEKVDIVEQLESPELQHAIRSLPDRRQEIIELLNDEWSQRQIAQKFGITEAAVSRHVRIIRDAVTPYYRENHWLKVNF